MSRARPKKQMQYLMLLRLRPLVYRGAIRRYALDAEPNVRDVTLLPLTSSKDYHIEVVSCRKPGHLIDLPCMCSTIARHLTEKMSELLQLLNEDAHSFDPLLPSIILLHHPLIARYSLLAHHEQGH